MIVPNPYLACIKGNPAFTVESFRGYCDPLEVYDFATPTEEVPASRIAAMRKKAADSDYVRDLSRVYADCGEYTGEVAFFVEQVTGHLVPDFRKALAEGVGALIAKTEEDLKRRDLSEKYRNNLLSFQRSLKCVLLLAKRYREIALAQMETACPERRPNTVLPSKRPRNWTRRLRK